MIKVKEQKRSKRFVVQFHFFCLQKEENKMLKKMLML